MLAMVRGRRVAGSVRAPIRNAPAAAAASGNNQHSSRASGAPGAPSTRISCTMLVTRSPIAPLVQAAARYADRDGPQRAAAEPSSSTPHAAAMTIGRAGEPEAEASASGTIATSRPARVSSAAAGLAAAARGMRPNRRISTARTSSMPATGSTYGSGASVPTRFSPTQRPAVPSSRASQPRWRRGDREPKSPSGAIAVTRAVAPTSSSTSQARGLPAARVRRVPGTRIRPAPASRASRSVRPWVFEAVSRAPTVSSTRPRAQTSNAAVATAMPSTGAGASVVCRTDQISASSVGAAAPRATTRSIRAVPE